LNRIEPGAVWRKILTNSQEIIEKQLPNFAGTWVTALFLAGLLVPFRNPTLSRLRWVLVAFVAALLLAQATGKTALSKEEPLVSSENLLVVAAPAAVIFGMGFLSVLLQGLVGPALRLMATGMVVGLAWVPFLISLTAFHGAALYPPGIQEKSLGVAEKERIMSDVPWAVAWYGDRTSVWLSLRHRDKQGSGNDFYSLHRMVPVSALYLGGEGLNAITTTAVAQWREESGARQGDDWTEFLQLASSLMKGLDTADRKEELETLRRLLQVADQHWAYGADKTWAEFLLGIYVNSEVPTGFPLKRAPFGLWPELFLTDTERNPAN
jgi:predicted membrane protein